MKVEKIELKHLAPYLPYGLNGIMEGKRVDFNTDNIYTFILNSKPILRPLSDLFKDEPDGDSFLDELRFSKEVNWCDAYDEFLDCCDIDNPEYIPNAPYEIVIWLLKNHFDVFELIESGLAVDINTLK